MTKYTFTKIFISVSFLAAFSTPILSASNIKFSGNSLPEYAIEADKNTGLDNIYVLYQTDGVSISYHTESTNPISWMRFSNLGGGFAEEVNNVSNMDGVYTIQCTNDDTGYMITDGDITYNFWITNYSNHKYEISDISFPSEQDCDMTILDVTGNASPIYYYTINGRQMELSRDINISYKTLLWNPDSKQYDYSDATKTLDFFNNQITITPPSYCNTSFIISSDRFMRYWKLGIDVESGLLSANAVNAMTEAIQESADSDSSNKIHTDIDGLGGSAPCTINFNSYVTDALIHFEWQMADDENFENVTYRINEHDFTYTFTEEGTTYIRFIGSNNNGSCDVIGDTYKVSIGASELLVPNAFSPNDDGVNDEWKVSYRSLLNFECWIFDIQGHQIFHFNDPNSGWDGKRNGKAVKPGVYYYVIQATGSDGKQYKKSGDINIINFKGSNSSSDNGK